MATRAYLILLLSNRRYSAPEIADLHEVTQLVDQHERLGVLPLPARSPQANPMEDLWRKLKNTVAANLERSL